MTVELEQNEDFDFDAMWAKLKAANTEEEETEDEVEDEVGEIEGKEVEEIDKESEIEDEEESDDEEIEEVETEKKPKGEKSSTQAQKRREREERIANQKLEEFKRTSKEFELVNTLAQMNGLSVDEMIAQLREQQIEQTAKTEGISVEAAKKQFKQSQEVEELKNTVGKLQYDAWSSQLSTQAEQLKSKYPTLTDNDIAEAKNYILHTVGNVNVTLQQAVYALHGEKLVESATKAKVQEDLAKRSGRSSKTPPSPNNSQLADQVELTNAEKAMIKKLGLSEKDFLANKNKK